MPVVRQGFHKAPSGHSSSPAAATPYSVNTYGFAIPRWLSDILVCFSETRKTLRSVSGAETSWFNTGVRHKMWRRSRCPALSSNACRKSLVRRRTRIRSGNSSPIRQEPIHLSDVSQVAGWALGEWATDMVQARGASCAALGVQPPKAATNASPTYDAWLLTLNGSTYGAWPITQANMPLSSW
jgi:hypothetical protein